MKKYKEKYLIALDLDGTLLNDKKKICKLTKKYLKRLNKKGVEIVLCSGRAPRSIINYYKELKINSPIISYNGALTFDPNRDDFEEIGYKFDKEILKNIYDSTRNYLDSAMCENNKKIFIDKDDAFLFNFFHKSNLEIIRGDIKEILTDDTYTFVLKLKESADTNEKRIELKNKIESIAPQYRLRYWWNVSYAELHYTEVSKAYALKELAKKLNINEDNVFVFGDADNDIEMLSSFKHSFFMKNGHTTIENFATYKTRKDNNHNGIMWELVRFFK